jgi:hypothetical protein
MVSRKQKQVAHQLPKQKKVAKQSKTQKKVANRPKRSATAPEKRVFSPGQPCCGLCGATRNLTKTECCGRWICDDEDQYVLFSFDRNSCHRNHLRYTLCGAHFNEQHPGRWQDCAKCREAIEPEMYAYYGTNEYNFEVLENPPAYEPTHCSSCGRVIVLAAGGYSHSRDGYQCGTCTLAKHPDLYD